MILDSPFDQLGRLWRREFFLGLPLKLRVFDEDGQHYASATDRIFRCDLGCFLVAAHLTIGTDAPRESGTQAGLMAAALGRRNSVAIGRNETIIVVRPTNRPFHFAGAARRAYLACEGLGGYRWACSDCCIQIVSQAPREAEVLALRCRLFIEQMLRITVPADLDAAI